MDEQKRALARFIRWVMRDTLYHVKYSATVERQHDDGTVDILPDSERVRGTGLSGVRIRHGIPGVDVRVKVGSSVLLGFEDGDPERPYVSLWERGSIDSISFDGGNRPIARQGDPVSVFWPPGAAVTGTISGLPFTGTITLATTSPGVIDHGAENARA